MPSDVTGRREWRPMPRTRTLRRTFARSIIMALRLYEQDPDEYDGVPGSLVQDAAVLARLQGIPIGVAAQMFASAYARGPSESDRAEAAVSKGRMP